MFRLVLGLWACFWAIPAFLHKPLKTAFEILHFAFAALKHSSLVEESELHSCSNSLMFISQFGTMRLSILIFVLDSFWAISSVEATSSQ